MGVKRESEEHTQCVVTANDEWQVGTVKYSKNYCRYLGITAVVLVVHRQKLLTFSHTLIDSCYLNIVAAG